MFPELGVKNKLIMFAMPEAQTGKSIYLIIYRKLNS